MLKPSGSSVTMRLLDPGHEPRDRSCKGCGTAPEEWTTDDGQVQSNGFVYVTGDELPMQSQGIYCEACVAKASKLGMAQRALRRKLGG